MSNLRQMALDRFQYHLPFSPGAAMNTDTVAAIFDCSGETVRKMLEMGEIRGYRLRPGVPKSPWRVYKDSVALYLQKLNDDFHLEDLDKIAAEVKKRSAKSANAARKRA